MADRKVIVVLHSLTLEDPIPHRSLTFSAASDRMEIGRASKRENKNLAPSPHNALFDSRVMSRTHAVLRVSLEKKLVYIRDPGSMHGTWLNKEKIPADKDIALSDGDELTFGVEVVRACDTFPPLRVRCECRWLENPKETVQKAQQQSATNTFSVPDDDYDDIEYLGDSLADPAAIDLTTDQTSDSNASSAGSGWDDSHSVAEVPSPMTSPAKDITSEDAQPTETSATLKQDLPQKVKLSNENVDDSEQPLATPRMTPPSVDYDSEDLGGNDQYYDEYFAHSSDEESNIEPEDWDVEAEGEDEEDEQEEQDDDMDGEGEREEEEAEEAEEALQDEQPQQQDEAVEMSALLNPVPGSFRLNDIQVPNDSISNFAKSGTNSKQTLSNEDWDAPRMVHAASDHPDLPGPSRVETAASNNRWPENKLPSTVSQQRERQISGNSSYFPIGPLQSSFANYEAERLRYQSSGQLPGQFSSRATPTLLPPILQKQPCTVRYSLDTMPLQGPYPMNAPYNDGPFSTSRPMASPTAPAANTSSSSSKPDIMPFMDSLTPMMPRTVCDVPHDLTASSSPRKRKAAEIESDAAEHDQERVISSAPETQQSSNKNDDLRDAGLPDAQPRTDAALINSESYIHNGSDSQLTTVSVSENFKEAKESERPSKIIKTSHRGSIRSHAATGIFGAVLGAVGTIAALASLPPDYFA